MKQFNKKGMEVSTILKLVVFLICLVVIVMLYNYIFNSADTLVVDQNCEASIKAYLASSNILGAPRDITKINCPVKEVYVESTLKDVQRKQIANTMKYCWEIWGNGNYELFESEGTYCHVCALVDFKYKGKVLDKMSDYLNNKQIVINNKPITYYQYMKPVVVNSGETIQVDGILAYANLDTSKKYAVIYSYDKKPEAKEYENFGDYVRYYFIERGGSEAANDIVNFITFQSPSTNTNSKLKFTKTSSVFLVPYIPEQLTFCQYIPVKQ